MPNIKLGRETSDGVEDRTVVELSGLCSLCGETSAWQNTERSIRESYRCANCGAGERWRSQASMIIDYFGRGLAMSFDQMLTTATLEDLQIYEVAIAGPFHRRLRHLEKYVNSYYWPDRINGDVYDGVRCEDITALTFADASFDLVISSDVLEHVAAYESAFREVARVLKPGGVHIFTIPNDWPMPANTERRVEIVDGAEVFVKEPRYHRSGDGGKCLVYQDFGSDLVDVIGKYGCTTSIVRRNSGSSILARNATFASQKVGS